MVDLHQPPGSLHRQQRDPTAAYNGELVTDTASATSLTTVVGEPRPGAVSVLVEPRLLTEDDIPWLFNLCRKKYSNRYDAITTEGWFRNVVLKQPLLFLPQRTPNAFCISLLTVSPWLPAEFECHISFLCADDGAMWEAMKLMRASLAWAKQRKCTSWKIASDTDIDLAMFARRIGATEVAPRFIIRL